MPPRVPISPDPWLQRYGRGLAWGSVGVLLGIVVGFVAGGYLACAPSESCEFKADLAGALGTWIGGLGTIGALVFAVVAFRNEEAARRRDEQARIEAEAARQVEAAAAREEAAREREAAAEARQRELERQTSDARRVRIGAQIGGTTGDTLTEFRAYVRNGTSTVLAHHVTGVSEEFGSLGYEHTLEPGGVLSQRFRGLTISRRPAIQLPADKDARDEWLQEQIELVDITFEMHGKRWTRRGTGPVELADEFNL